MMEIIVEKNHTNMNESWKDFLHLFNGNSHNDTISLWNIWDELVILVKKREQIKLVWYDEKTEQIMSFDEAEYSLLENSIELKYRTKFKLQEKADLILNILCKKEKLDYISSLRSCHIMEDELAFINNQRLYDYITAYLTHLEMM